MTFNDHFMRFDQLLTTLSYSDTSTRVDIKAVSEEGISAEKPIFRAKKKSADSEETLSGTALIST